MLLPTSASIVGKSEIGLRESTQAEILGTASME